MSNSTPSFMTYLGVLEGLLEGSSADSTVGPVEAEGGELSCTVGITLPDGEPLEVRLG